MDQAWLRRVATVVEDDLRAGRILSKDDLHKVKQAAAREIGAPTIPKDTDLVPLMDKAVVDQHALLLTKKPMRSRSGVAIVAVMSSPEACPHGKCIYCPGGPDADAPQSYTGFEPSTMRAKRHDYDAYKIVRSRLAQLEKNGHAIDKLELIIQGGTFPARDPAYQDWFVHGIYQGANDGPDAEPEGGQDLATWEAADQTTRDRWLKAAQDANETSDCRVIGLTIETKPDWCFEDHVDAMLRHGATRIELGIQTLDEEVTRITNRGHTVADAARAMRVARDAGYKICVHDMPGLPRPRDGGYRVDPAADIEDLRRLFAEPEWRPDMLKIYPMLVVKEGETTVKRWWQTGRFEPLDTAGAVDVVAEALRHVPPWCRIQRIDRDIPTTHVLAGVMNSNLRQLAEEEARRRGIELQDIRAREVGTRAAEGHPADPGRLTIVRRDYEAAGSTEVFLSHEDPEADAIASFLRLRRIGHSHRAELDGAAAVRELKVYGQALALGETDDDAWQHRGLGKALLAVAERIAFEEWGVARVTVLAGPGVKPYYRRHGYTDSGPYLQKARP